MIHSYISHMHSYTEIHSVSLLQKHSAKTVNLGRKLYEISNLLFHVSSNKSTNHHSVLE